MGEKRASTFLLHSEPQFPGPFFSDMAVVFALGDVPIPTNGIAIIYCFSWETVTLKDGCQCLEHPDIGWEVFRKGWEAIAVPFKPSTCRRQRWILEEA